MEKANNSHVRDFKASNGSVIQDFSGNELEHTYFLRNKQEIESFFKNKADYVKELSDIKDKMKFDNITVNFKATNLSKDLQKELVKFQNEACDKIVVKLNEKDFDVFKSVFEYAVNNFNKPVIAYVDIKLRTPMLLEIFEYFKIVTPSEIIFKYRKIDTNILKYRLISKILTDLGIPYSVSESRKRCGIKDFWEISASAVLKAQFGFRNCCLNYNYPNKNGFPSGEIDKFVLDSFSWEKQKNQDYYNNRLKDFANLNKIKLSQSEIDKRKKFKRLLNHLDTLK